MRFTPTLLCAVTLCLASTAACAAWPERPIKAIVPYAPGSSPDNVMRPLMQEMAKGLGVAIVIDNRPGASATVGTEAIAKSAPDGYTLGYGNIGSLTTNRFMIAKLPYDPDRDLTLIGMAGAVQNMLAVNNNLPVKNVQELIAYAKARPGKVNYAAGTTGATAHLSGELLKSMAKINIVHVPYKGTGAQLTSIVAGETQFTFASVPAALPFVKGGRARAIAVGSLKRSPALPDVPTVAESGIPGFDVNAWNGVMVPRGTPAPVVELLGREMKRVTTLADMKDRAAAQGAELTWTTPQEFTTYLNGQVAKWGKLVRESGMQNN